MAQIMVPFIKLELLKNYLDDIIIFGPDFNTLVGRLRVLFDLLVKKGLNVKMSKYTFAQTEVKLLGRIFSEQGCRPDPANIEAIQNMRPPTNTKEVRRSLGMWGSYRKRPPICSHCRAFN